MKLYFMSDDRKKLDAAVKINGELAGVTSKRPKFLETDEDNFLVELLPLAQGDSTCCPISFVLNEEFTSKPASSVKVTDLGGHFMISPLFTGMPLGKSSVIKQERTVFQSGGTALVTVYFDGCFKVNIDYDGRFIMENIDELDQVEISGVGLGRERFAVINGFFGLERTTYIYHLGENIRKVFQNTLSECKFEDYFYTLIDFHDIAGHKAQISWEFTGESFKRRNYTLKKTEGFSPGALKKELIPYAFFEEVFCKGPDIREFLADGLKDNADRLLEYLGDFSGIIPPPHFKRQDSVGLIYKKKENYCYVKWYCPEIKNGQIYNILRD